MNIKHITIIALAIFAFSSCDSLLDIPQHGAQDFDHYYSTDYEAETAINAAYIQLRGNETNCFMGKNTPSDDAWAGGANRNDNSDLEQLHEFSFNAEQDYIQGMFEGYYGVIYKCNVVLGHCTGDSEVMQRVRAEAKVIRAMQYFDLITLWGNPPLVDHELSPTEYSQPNGSTEDLWNLVNNDLKEAIESGRLPEKANKDDKSVWRVTKQYAEALYGKALLWQEKYAESAKQFESVISSGKYDLYPVFEDIYLYSNKRSCESMFESVRMSNPSNAFENFEFTHAFLGWRQDKLTMTAEASNRFACMQAYGFLTPTKDLYDAFVAEEGVDGYRLNSTLRTVAQMAELGITIKDAQINEGYFQWKRRVEGASVDPSSFGFSCENDPIWMRYAEVLLLAAEANLMAGNQAKADEYLNKVRTRAHLGNKTATLEAIQIEKRLELCYDMCRFQDLQRWGLAEKVLANQGGKYPLLQPNGNIDYVILYDGDSSKYGYKSRHAHLPYPAAECRLNKNITQNIGW